MMLQRITERASDVLYHMTSVMEVAMILHQNTFELTPTFKHDSEPYKKLFFLSTSRTRFNYYFIEDGKHKHVREKAILTLDGRKLSNLYYATPINFFPKDKKIDKHEAEDRIYNDRPLIPNAKNYIMETHILVDSTLEGTTLQGGVLRPHTMVDMQSYQIIQNSGIPAFIYDSRNAFFLQAKGTPLNEIEMIPPKDDSIPKTFAMFDNSNPITSDALAPWIYLLTKPARSNWNSLPAEVGKVLAKLKKYRPVTNRNHFQDAVRMDMGDWKILDAVAQAMKKNKLKNGAAVAKFLRAKWLGEEA